jgi:cytochrome P450
MYNVKVSGIEATFEPVDWHPAGLPEDPDDIVSWITDPQRRGELFPLYHQLRRVAPIHKCPPHLLHGAWVLTRFADVQAVLKNPTAVNDPRVVDEAFNHGDGAFYQAMRNTMVFAEASPHQRLRTLVVRAFTPRAIARWRPIAERVANELCDGVAADGGMELVQQFNYELPFNVIAHILGVPRSDFPYIKQLAWDFARAGERTVTDEVAKRGDDAARGFQAYFSELAEARSKNPTDDLITELVHVEQDGDRLTRHELVGNCVLLMQAGHETTQDLLGNSMVALFRHPDQLARLRANLDLVKGAVEEFLRYDGSVQTNHRLLLEDLHLGDVVLPAGDMVHSLLGAANRDPAEFADPDRLDIERPIRQHLAFAFGAYYCVGAALARTEVSVGVRTLLERFPGIRPASDTFQWRDTLTLRGPLRLEVTW